MYHSLIKLCDAVIGNSSSGMAEVPYFKNQQLILEIDKMAE